MRTTAITLLAALCLAPMAWTGDLTPPGAPAPTMKTLDEVEPRTPISSIPFAIDASGSYYLAATLSIGAQDTDGITITADNVNLDLNGFALIGAGNDVGASGTGIMIAPTQYNIAIRNGTLRDWRLDGAQALISRNCQIERLRCHANGDNGIYGFFNSALRSNTCSGNLNAGIYAGDGNTITGNVCQANAVCGIGTGSGCVLVGNVCNGNGAMGMAAGSRSVVRDNTCGDNGGGNAMDAGMFVSGQSTVVNNTCAGNDGHGIYLWVGGGSLATGNTCSENSAHGIVAYQGARVLNNVCESNGYLEGDGAGIYVSSEENCIEGNFVRDNDRGIEATGTHAKNNFIAGNRARGNTTDYDITTTPNLVGQIVDGTSGGTISTTDPHANFRF